HALPKGLWAVPEPVSPMPESISTFPSPYYHRLQSISRFPKAFPFPGIVHTTLFQQISVGVPHNKGCRNATKLKLVVVIPAFPGIFSHHCPHCHNNDIKWV